MADVITRFKLETSQYDSKLRDSVKGLKEVVRMNEIAGKDFKEFSDKAIEAARALGQQATGATNAKDKVKELVSAYNDMAKSYNFMTDAMKNSEGGKALASSLEQLQQRIKDAKSEMNATPGVLDKLKDRFVLNVDALKLFNIGLQAVNGALSVAKDAFFASEANVDEWGRTVASAQSVYEGFLTALNTGDVSGFLGHIDQIVTAARAAYDELDKLGTMKTIQSPQVSAQQAEVQRFQSMLRTGKYIEPAAGSGMKAAPGMKNGDVLTKDQMRAIEQHLIKATDNLVKLTGNEVKQTGKAINAVYQRFGTELGMSEAEFRKGTSNWAEFTKRIEGATKYQEYERQHTTQVVSQTTGAVTSLRDNSINPYAQYKGWSEFRVDGDRYAELVRLIQQRDQQMSAMYGQQSQAYRTINRVEGITPSKIMGNGGGGGTATTKELDPLQQVQKQIADLSKEALMADDARLEEITKQVSALQEQERTYKQIQDRVRSIYDINAEIEKQYPQRDVSGQQAGQQLSFMDQARQDYALQLSAKNIEIDETTFNSALQVALQNGLDGLDVDFTTIKEKMAEGMDIPDETWEELQNTINEKLAELDIDPIEINFKTGNVKDQAKEMAKDWNEAGTAIQAVGSAMQAIEDPAAKVMGTIAQAIATVALTFAKSLEKTFGPWDWIAAAATGVATMATTISAIKSATAGNYASGGIIPGNSWSGDNMRGITPDGTLYGLDAGELILNRSQQNTIAAQLTGGNQQAQGGASSTPYVSGEQIFLGLNNYLRRTGRGELVTAH